MPDRTRRSITALAVSLSLAPGSMAIAAPETAPPEQRGDAPDPTVTPEPAAPAPEVPEVLPEVLPEVMVERRVDTPGDELVLRDGSLLRGTVVELRHGSHVTIVVVDQPHRIEWAELERVRLGAPQPAPASPAAPPASAPAQSTSGLRVHLDSLEGQHLTLYRISREFMGSGSIGTVVGITYEPVCSGTCGKTIDGTSGHQFFVAGEGVTPSRSFRLDQEAGDLTLAVKGGNRAARVSGWVLVALGAPLLLSGIVTLGLDGDHPVTRGVGAGFAVAGAVGLGAGIPLMLVGRTIIERRRGR